MVFVTIGTSAPFSDDNVCCEDTLSFDLSETNSFSEYNNEFENILYIPFKEITIRDFGIHKYVIFRNIRTLMTYHSNSHIMNIIFKSMNQSFTEITNIVNANIAEFENMAQNEFVANFLDFWCAYRIIQLSKFTTDNLDLLFNIFNGIAI
jgi:hypothetical protein